MAKTWWDVKRPKKTNIHAYQISRWLSQVPHGGIVGNMAVLICYNERNPERSFMVVEEINNL